MAIKLIKYEAEWCSPCKTQDEILEDFDSCEVEHVDIDDELERAQDAGIFSVPTLVIEVDGAEMDRFTGVTPVEELEASVKTLS